MSGLSRCYRDVVFHGKGRHAAYYLQAPRIRRHCCPSGEILARPGAVRTTEAVLQLNLDELTAEESELLTKAQNLADTENDIRAVSFSTPFRNILPPWPVTRRMLDDAITMFNTMLHEYDYWIQDAWVTGQIPKELKGTYLRNGAGLQVNNGKQQRHFMDGDGCVLSLAFPGDGRPPRFMNKYVRTKGFLDEQAAGKPVHRNAFTRGSPDGSKVFNPFNLNFKNIANTGVLYWSGRMWALWEVGKPYELCPRTLATLGETDLEGRIGQRLAGHYKVVTEEDGKETAVLFGTQVSFNGLHLEFYELNQDGDMLHKYKADLDTGMDIMFIHDMLVTEHWYIVILGPVELDLGGFFTDYLTGKKSLAELLVYNKDKCSKVHLFPRPGRSAPQSAGPYKKHCVQAPPFFSFHHVNAYETHNGQQVVIDTISWQSIAFNVTQYTVTEEYYKGGCRTQLYRLLVDLPTSSLLSCEQLLTRTVEFPAMNSALSGKPYRFAYFPADTVNDCVDWAPAQALIKVTLPVHGEEPAAACNANVSQAEHTNMGTDDASLQSQSPGVTSNNIVTFKNGSAASTSHQPECGVHLKGHNSTVTATPHDTSQTGSSTQADMYGAGSPGTPEMQSRDVQEQHDWQHQQPQGQRHCDTTFEEWRPGPRCFPQEPLFVPRPGATAEDDGWIIMGVHDASTLTGQIVILDARHISEGPVAVIHLPHALPPGLHGSWADEYLGPDLEDTSVPAWSPHNTIRQI